MILIGSHAMFQRLGRYDRTPADYDYICTFDEYKKHAAAVRQTEKDGGCKVLAMHPISEGKKMLIKTDKVIYEYEIAWSGSTAEKLVKLVQEDPDTDGMVPSLDVLYMLKMTHRFKKNSPHFLKTMADIRLMREHGAKIRPEHMEFFKEREKETYTYSHPKLNQSKKDFFNTPGIVYTYVHDDIHGAVKHLDRPAYEYYKPDAAEVFCSKDMFYAVDESVRLYGVLEEAYVLAIERSQVPFPGTDPKDSFLIALEKVCTSITSGWFREYAWENYEKIVEMYDESYVQKFWNGVESGQVRKVQN